MPKIPETTIKKIIGLRRRKLAYSKIAETLKVSLKTIKKYAALNNLGGKLKKAGRPKKLNPDELKSLGKKFAKNKVKSLAEGVTYIQKRFKTKVCRQTIANNLKKMKIKCLRKKKKPLLTERHKGKRLDFAEEFKDFTIDDWKRVIWSDESKFCLINSNNVEYCWIKKGDDLKDEHVQGTLKFGGGSVMVWGCITAKGKGELIRIDGIMDAAKYIEILRDGLLRTYEKYELPIREYIFMQDNDPKHTAKITKRWLEDYNINVMKWPAQSPDMNPIENLWGILDKKLRKRSVKPRNNNELFEFLKEEWLNIPDETIRKLYLSMPERVGELRRKKGSYTKW